MLEKINDIVDDNTLFLAILLLVVALTSFGLGQLAERARYDTTHQESAAVSVTQSDNRTNDIVVASKHGTKYHLPWCVGAQQMNEENKIEFESKTAAEAAGYSPASNCPGI